jgi:hypothetical protein
MRNVLRLIYILFAFVLINSCTKEEDAPENPYDNIVHGQDIVVPDTTDPNSIVGLHKNIFSVRCANPGCHDGTFEPDFRTVESSFASLVYQPVNLDSIEGSTHRFTLRVIPHDVANSWIIERLTTTSSDYMPSNGGHLPQSQIDNVKNWINAGCPDKSGVPAVKPNLQPNVVGYIALDGLLPTSNRLDTNRYLDIPFGPFIAPYNISMTLAFVAKDTADGADATPDSLFTVKKILFSTDKNDFTNATSINASLYLFGAWIAFVPTGSWPQGTTVYFRIAVNDGHHPSDAIFPRNESLDYYKTYFSFYVQ